MLDTTREWVLFFGYSKARSGYGIAIGRAGRSSEDWNGIDILEVDYQWKRGGSTGIFMPIAGSFCVQHRALRRGRLLLPCQSPLAFQINLMAGLH